MPALSAWDLSYTDRFPTEALFGMLRRGGTSVLNGLPPGEFPVSIFDLVLNGYTSEFILASSGNVLL